MKKENKSKLEKIRRGKKIALTKDGVIVQKQKVKTHMKAYKEARETYESTLTEQVIRANATTLKTVSPEIVIQITKRFNTKRFQKIADKNTIYKIYKNVFDKGGDGDNAKTLGTS